MVGNITKATTCKSFFHQVIKTHNYFFFVAVLYNNFYKTNVHRWFFGVRRKYELCVSFNFKNPFQWSQSKKDQINDHIASKVFKSKQPLAHTILETDVPK